MCTAPSPRRPGECRDDVDGAVPYRFRHPSLRANGSRECAPDDRLREAIHLTAVPVVRWIASSQVLLAMTWRHFDSNFKQQTHIRILAAPCARGLRFVVPPKGGSRECRMHAAPAVPCAKETRKSHTSIQGSGGDPTFPAQWLYDLYRAHPGVSGVLAPVASRKLALRPGWAFAPPKGLTPTTEASDPRDFAVRFSTARQHAPRPLTEFIPPCRPVARTMPSRPPHPIPTFGDDGQRPFLGDRMA